MKMEQIYVQTETQLKQAYVLLADLLKTGAIDIRYQPHRRSKSMEQLGYYYGCVLPLLKKRMEKDGNVFSLDEIDLFLKNRFFAEEAFNPISGKTERVVKMKRNANIAEMSVYLEKVVTFCREELELHIPDAKDYTTIKELGL